MPCTRRSFARKCYGQRTDLRSAGNYRVLMVLGDEPLAYGMGHDVAQLDEKCYLGVLEPRNARPALKTKVKV